MYRTVVQIPSTTDEPPVKAGDAPLYINDVGRIFSFSRRGKQEQVLIPMQADEREMYL